MDPGYIEIDDLCHLDRSGEVSSSDPLWRESHYFNMTDPGTGISLITTIGVVPNRSRTAGFLLLVRGGRTVLLRPVHIGGDPRLDDRAVEAGGLRYSVEGANWRVSYRSRRADVDVVFTPLNRVFPYTDEKGGPIECIATQHYEQAGTFRGKVRIGRSSFNIGPCHGHRDHSWGVRDWAGIESYTLLSCTFPDGRAVNVWQGEVRGKTFLRGYLFDGRRNVRIARARIDPFFTNAGRPVSCTFELTDDNGDEHSIGALVRSDHVFPPAGALVHETVAEVRMDDRAGHGLLEFLERSGNIGRIRAALALLSRMGASECRS